MVKIPNQVIILVIFHFCSCALYACMQISEESMMVKANKLKEDIHLLFKTFNNTVVEKMTLLDTLQRLGIDHLFQEQINTAMNQIHESEFNSCDLYDVSLRFRLLREHGIWVSPGIYLSYVLTQCYFNPHSIIYAFARFVVWLEKGSCIFVTHAIRIFIYFFILFDCLRRICYSPITM